VLFIVDTIAAVLFGVQVRVKPTGVQEFAITTGRPVQLRVPASMLLKSQIVPSSVPCTVLDSIPWTLPSKVIGRGTAGIRTPILRLWVGTIARPIRSAGAC